MSDPRDPVARQREGTLLFTVDCIVPYYPVPAMTFVTKLTFTSGDRDTLERVVRDIRDNVRRKGAQIKGPHSDTPENFYVSQYKSLDGDESDKYSSWNYTVYQRRLEIHGHDDLARRVMERDLPASIRMEADIERVKTVGSTA